MEYDKMFNKVTAALMIYKPGRVKGSENNCEQINKGNIGGK